MGFIEDKIAEGYGGYRGWTDEAAARADWNATQGAGKWDPGSSQQAGYQSSASGIGDFNNYVSQAQEMYKKSAEPVISSLQAAIPEVKTAIATQSQTLKDRYDNLIKSLSGRETGEKERQTVVTSGELGKRGIDPTSTLYGQELVNAIRPITSEYSGLLSSAATEQAAGMQGLAQTETEQLRNIANAIAQAQMGIGTNAVDLASSFYNAEKTAAASREAAAAEKEKGVIETIGGSKYLVNPYTGSKTYLGPATTGEEGTSLADILKAAGLQDTQSRGTDYGPQPAPNYFVPDQPEKTINVMGVEVPESSMAPPAPVAQKPGLWDYLGSLFNKKTPWQEQQLQL